MGHAHRIAFCSALTLLVAATLVTAEEKPLAGRIAAITDQAPYKQSHWGLLVVDEVSGDVLFEHNADKLFAPASVTKLFSVAAALDAFGADHCFRTPIVRRGEVNAEGQLDGDLILIASGDLTLGGRTTNSGEIEFTTSDHTYAEGGSETELTSADPLAGFNDLARQVAGQGIKRVAGDVLIDDRLFEHAEGTGSGPSRLTPIMVNDNLIDITIEPTEPGKPAKMTVRPQTACFPVECKVLTSAAGGKAQTSVRSFEHRLVVHGSIPHGHKPVVRVHEAPSAALFARTLLIEALARTGVEVEAPTVSDSQSELPPRDQVANLPEVGAFKSPPFAGEARLILKVSHNLHASTLPLLLAAKHGERTLAEGLHRERHFLEKAGIDVASIAFGGGAGGARADFVTPRATVQLLRYMAKRDDAQAYRVALPILGVDGTLAKTVDETSKARGKVFAKTGTLFWHNTLNDRMLLTSKALAGYMTTSHDRKLAFAIFVNNVPLAGDVDAKSIGRDLGKLCEVLHESF
jgi:D-alanyl-D-alanine carboxypeptidase/D-alanyl-D-alanine-endopeptidase (penicillin-binding protein 4)